MSVDTTAPAAVIEAVNISKSFGPVPVLFSVSMDVRPGEVHALIGENGAGKSTLMKILSGFHDPTSGQIRLDGKQTDLPANGGAEKLGVVLIHQELNLAEQMTVEENVFLGREIKSNGFLDKAAMQATVPEVSGRDRPRHFPDRSHFRPYHRPEADGRDRQGPSAGTPAS